jgi:predicted alpha/beta hydrolase family esterase
MSDLLKTTTVLVVPGWNGSGPGHWQSIWERQNANFQRIEQHNWVRPSRRAWVEAIDLQIQRAQQNAILVAHSLGCIAVAGWAENHDTSRISAALMVTPPWLTTGDNCPPELAEFLPVPTRRLPFPTIFVASENDPYLPSEIAPRLAKAWGSEYVNVGRQGHINIASGHGLWPEGELLLQRLVLRTNATADYGAVAKW